MGEGQKKKSKVIKHSRLEAKLSCQCRIEKDLCDNRDTHHEQTAGSYDILT